MTTMKRRLRFRLRFGFGLAAGLTVLMVFATTAFGASPKPPVPKTSAGSQYAAPTVVTYVSLTAAKVGKCKLAVTKRYVPKKKACKTKKACAIVAKAELAAKKQCGRVVQTAKAKPKVTPKKVTIKTTKKP